jgi:phosphate transport system substrate-binding protein
MLHSNTRSLFIHLAIIGLIVLLGLAGQAAAEHAGIHAKPVLDPALPGYEPGKVQESRLTIAGSDSMQPLMARLAAEFRHWHPQIKLGVQGGGTESALESFLQGMAFSRRGDGNVKGHLGSNGVMLLAASRPLTHDEIEGFRSRFGYDPTEVPIALDAMALYVHRDNPLAGLTLNQLDAIFSSTRKRGFPEDIRTWGQLGLKEDWKDAAIHLYGRGKQSGTRFLFKQEVLLDGEFKSEVRQEQGNASMILAVARDPFAIGYAGTGFQASLVRVIPLAGKAGAAYVMPTEQSILDATYPLRRHLYLYVNKDPNEELPKPVLEFLKFVNSREGQLLVVKAGAYPLPMAEVAKNLQTITGATLATADSERTVGSN